jgi:hypothetical protein
VKHIYQADGKWFWYQDDVLKHLKQQRYLQCNYFRYEVNNLPKDEVIMIALVGNIDKLLKPKSQKVYYYEAPGH